MERIVAFSWQKHFSQCEEIVNFYFFLVSHCIWDLHIHSFENFFQNPDYVRISRPLHVSTLVRVLHDLIELFRLEIAAPANKLSSFQLINLQIFPSHCILKVWLVLRYHHRLLIALGKAIEMVGLHGLPIVEELSSLRLILLAV